MKAIEWSPRAARDAADAAYWYARQAGLPLGLRFLAQVDQALELIARHPLAGSVRHAPLIEGLSSPLRFVTVRQFDRYLVYYVDLPERVQVIRIWDATRGLSALDDDDP